MGEGPYTSDSTTLVPGFVRGFRAWALGFSSNVPTLAGAVHSGYLWQPGRNKAECRVGSFGAHDGRPISIGVPDPHCSCGLYARFADDRHGYIGVKGIVKATGNIVLGTEGFRAQYAEVEAFYVDNTLEEYLRAVNHNLALFPGYFPKGQPIITRSGACVITSEAAPLWVRRKSAASLLELFASDYGVKIYPSAEAAREAFPFPSIEELIGSWSLPRKPPERKQHQYPGSSPWSAQRRPLRWQPAKWKSKGWTVK